MFEAFLIKEGECKGNWGVMYMNGNYPSVVIFNPLNMRIYGHGGVAEAIAENKLGKNSFSGAIMHANDDPFDYLSTKRKEHDGRIDEFRKKFKLQPKA